MNDALPTRTGGRILVDTLLAHGADTGFCVPGESYLEVLDALWESRNRFRLITCRQEGGAANMAEADGKLTGRPGICLVTRGPGATNASIGVHTAFQDSTPMLLLVGQVARDMRGREAFQEVDLEAMFAPLAKWVVEIDDPRRIPELVGRAWRTATSGRPGPVVISLPEDMLRETCAAPDTEIAPPVQASPAAAAMTALRARLAAAARPLMILGGGAWTAAARDDIEAFATASGIPVAVSFRRQDRFDNHHPLYAGDVGIGINPALLDRLRASDLILAVGTRLGEMTTDGYTRLAVPDPEQPLVHVHPDPEEIGRVYRPVLGICAGMAEFAAAARALDPVDFAARADQARDARADYEIWTGPRPIPGAVQMYDIVRHMQEVLPPDTIVTNGAGNYSVWCNRFWRYRDFATQIAPTSGAMGYGVPAAVAAKARHPARTVVSFAGDGCFLMNGQELSTAVQHGLDFIVLVVDNGMYGTIRMHQEGRYPGRVSGTDLRNPDFAALARACGAHGETVRTTAEFAPAFARAREAGGPALLHLLVDPEAITANTTLTAIREGA